MAGASLIKGDPPLHHTRFPWAGGPWRSIDRRLPLLISGLLLAAIVVFAWAAYRRVQHILLAAAGPRLQSVSTAINVLMAESVVSYEGRLVRAASDAVVADFLRTGRNGPAARRALATVWTLEPNVRGRVAVRRPNGAVVLDTATDALPPASDWVVRTIDTAALSPGAVRVGPFIAIGDSTYYEAIAAVGAASGSGGRKGPARQSAILGYVSDFHLVTGQNAGVVRDLIGTHAVMLLGSPATGVWSDLQHRVAPPRVEGRGAPPHLFRRSAGSAGVGVATPVAGAPWVLWVEQPAADVLAPMHPLLTEIAILAALVIATGAAGAWLVSRRVTRPIISLTTAAERIAPGLGTSMDSGGRGDEIARLNECVPPDGASGRRVAVDRDRRAR